MKTWTDLNDTLAQRHARITSRKDTFAGFAHELRARLVEQAGCPDASLTVKVRERDPDATDECMVCMLINVKEQQHLA